TDTRGPREGAVPQPFAVMPFEQQPRIIHWFGDVPAQLEAGKLDPHGESNIRREDYSGAEACKKCHEKNYEQWLTHPHRLMNGWAEKGVVRGDFSEGAKIEYMGGVGRFFMEGEEYRMSLERDGVKRVFDLERTIGSRFFQYYIGKMLQGPEAEEHEMRQVGHVMPFGYWFDEKEWVPIVNVGNETPDSEREDPFEDPGKHPYDKSCSACHTTRPTGDMMLRAGMMRRLDAYSPRVVHFALEDYLNENHPDLMAGLGGSAKLGKKEILGVMDEGMKLSAEHHAVNLGISCEACHNGCADHVADENVLPSFFPKGKNVVVSGANPEEVWGRNAINVNWTCSRCHAGGRERYASGISTWNSTELSDAARGSCYDPVKAEGKGMGHLTCVHCHSPHQGIGPKWQKTAVEDNRSCTVCHDQFQDEISIQKHTHHPAGSSGSECMNCHMPRINEGLQDVVRTHTIFDPTNVKMLESNQPNACNLCHVDKPIDWTLDTLDAWYGETGVSRLMVKANYPEREEPVALGWLKSEHHGTRLVGADALTRQGATWATAEIIDLLDDPYLVNRQFAAKGLEKLTGVDARDYGYRFYHFEKERAEPLRKLREVLLKAE
ncbi:MAG: hypothetical protein P8J87_18085, partial [Verrucomicrobiales bacterium]|nr:hypothetical protein [Verrucomicrobiales bacterium]